jgi:hypothetical protein
MTIHSFIQSQVLLPRLQQHGVLIVYDPDQRYRDLCLEIASENRIVVDAGVSSIEARESAMATLQQMGRWIAGSRDAGLRSRQAAVDGRTEAARSVCCVHHVRRDLSGRGRDEYQSLCLRAKPDHATAIRRVFAESPIRRSQSSMRSAGARAGPTCKPCSRWNRPAISCSRC